MCCYLCNILKQMQQTGPIMAQYKEISLWPLGYHSHSWQKISSSGSRYCSIWSQQDLKKENDIHTRKKIIRTGFHTKSINKQPRWEKYGQNAYSHLLVIFQSLTCHFPVTSTCYTEENICLQTVRASVCTVRLSGLHSLQMTEG